MTALLLAHALGLFGAGLPAAVVLNIRPRWAAAFTLSWLSLVWGVIALQIVGLPITFASAMAWQAGVAIVSTAWWRWRRGTAPRPTIAPPDASLSAGLRATLVVMLVALALLFTWRLLMAPLSGADVPFRWNHLAVAMLQERSLDFYPPISAADYRVYFFPDAIAPVAAAPYWLLYAAWGEVEPRVTTLFVLVQWLTVIGFTHRLGRNLGGESAGWFAAAMAGGSYFLFHAIGIGQDIGATSVGIAGAMAVLTEPEERGIRRAIAAALLCGVAALVREYGVLLLGVAMVPILLDRRQWRSLPAYALIAAAVIGPWYLRNLLRMGHPFHSVPAPLFEEVSSVYVGILEATRDRPQSANEWLVALGLMLRTMPLAALAGPIMLVMLARRRPALLIATVLLLAICVQAAMFSAGGAWYALRVAGPAVALACAAAAVGLARWTDQCQRWRMWACAILVAQGLWAAALGSAFPFVADLRQPGKMLKAMTIPYQPVSEEQALAAYLNRHLPPGTRILSDNAYVDAYLRPMGFDVVPVWSPEVAFVFDPQRSVEQVTQGLALQGIEHVLVCPFAWNTRYLERHALFQSLTNWPVAARAKSGNLVLYRMPGADASSPSR